MLLEGVQGEHRIRIYYTEAGPVFSCHPCRIYAEAYPTTRVRNRAVERHLEGKPHTLKNSGGRDGNKAQRRRRRG